MTEILISNGSVGNPAVLTNLPSRPCQQVGVTHLDHGPHEIAEEPSTVGAVGLHQRLGAGDAFRAGEEALVRGQEALLVEEVLVIMVVEHICRACIQRSGLVAVTACTEALEAGGKCCVQRWVY
jgi:hypothetical protein